MKKIILASQSPRRKMLLEWAEVTFEVKVKETDESYPAGTKTDQVPIVIARNKALAIEKSSNEIVIAADTIVVLEDEIIGKPVNAEDARNILQKLSGKTHQVITGVVMISGEEEVSFSDITEVSFYQLSDEQINYYIDKYKPFDKAGAYAIQEWIGVTGIERINGDFYNVMGLPVSRVVKTLHQLGQNTYRSANASK
jgi:septum formation protein